MIRRLLAAAAVGAFVLGLVAALAPGLVAVGTDRIVVGVVGALALVQAIRLARARRREPSGWAALPDPELPPSVPAPGEDLDAVLLSFVDARRTYHAGNRVRAELRAAAATVLAAYGDVTASTARELVEEGRWTDDEYAAAFLADDPLPEPALWAWVRSLLGGESGYRRGLRRAVAAVADATDLPPPAVEDRDDEPGLRTRLQRRFGDHWREGAPTGAVADGGAAADPSAGAGASTGRRSIDDAAAGFDGATGFDGAAGSDHVADESTGDAGDESLGDAADGSAVAATGGSTGDAADESVGGATDGSVGDAGAASATAAEEATGEPIPTGHWYGVGALALAAVGVGVLASRPAVLLVGVVGIGYAAYGRAGATPAHALSVERTVADSHPEPGETVAVTATVENRGEDTVPDLRLADGVPAGLPVDGGTPRLGTALRPGERASVEYEVTARRGVHRFGPPRAALRDLPEAVERPTAVAADAPGLRVAPALEPLSTPVPLRRRTAGYAGPVETDSGGEGVEFYATREYRPGDPMNRVDWNRHARTGELSTLEFREERTATVVVAVDARPPAYVGPRRSGEHAVDRSANAAGRAFATLLAGSNRAGLAALGDGDCWLAPGRGEVHRTRARELLATAPPTRAEDAPRQPASRWKPQLFRRLPADAQVLLFSPLVDDGVVALVRRLEARGHPATVVSPDPTVADAPGRRLARVARRIRITDLRETGVRVVDWNWGEPLDVALARAREQWSR